MVSLAVMLCVLPWRTDSFAQGAPDVPEGLDPAVARGLDYLAKRQNSDGSFDAGEHRVALSGLAVMSYLACGHTPDAGRYGLTVRAGVDYLLSQAGDDGYFGRHHGKGMYDQGIVTLALAEAYGVEPDPERRRRMFGALAKAVKVILEAQAVQKAEEHAGGWRYQRNSPDSDISLSGWNALALRAARDVGVDVPKEAVQKAIGFLLRCYNTQQNGFSYQAGGGAQAGPTGIGVLGLYVLDGTARPELGPAAKYLADNPVNDGTPFQYYSTYYSTLAADQAGGPVWEKVSKANFARLLGAQATDGSWPKNGQEPGETYAASMAVLTLSVPYRLLPVYQR